MRTVQTRTRIAALLAPVAATVLAVPGPAWAAPDPAGSGCPVLWVLGVQGTGQSSPGASRTDDTGMLGALLGPVTAAAGTLVQHTYVPYAAGFGGVVGAGGDEEPYADSVTDVIADLGVEAQRIVDQCPDTELALVGFSQGAQAVSQVARAIGAGNGPVAPNKIAAVALYANPERRAGGPVLAGRPGQSTPDPAPGTSGAAVSTVHLAASPASGSGIADDGASYGSLTGRVLDVCADGDLACSAPEHADLLRVAALIAAQADLSNPVAAGASLHQLLSQVLGSAWTTMVLDDVVVGPGSVDYQPREPLSQRVIDAADPRIPGPDLDRVQAAQERWNEISAAVVAHPGELVKLAGQLSGAVAQLGTDNADLANPAVWARLAAAVPLHDGYAVTGQLASGIAWLVAVAHDLAEGGHR
ncbi:cutinase family protein [Nocardia nova]|uniref:cutinase family protein n=1 Tax=Nocardia nova TaxID=37330 RepID=UPI001C47D4AA|nr:cutinase family protein [Nocardia nova]MBV7706816.1 cutinase family protein [Nocardia nova]